jgi:uncharacterized protein (DUF58 family)
MAEIPEKIYKNIRRLQISSNHIANDLLVGAYRSYFRGKGMEFKEVREYQPGDEVRSIDWNVTARYQRPYVKTFHEERELTVHIMMDVSTSLQFGGNSVLKRERLAEVGALIAFAALQNNDKVGLILFSDGVEKYIPPKKGMHHVLRIIREMLVYKTVKQGTNLKEALIFLGKVQKRAGICFLLSDFLCETNAHDFNLIAKKNDLIAVEITDAYETVLPNLNVLTVMDLETGQEGVFNTNSPGLQQVLKQMQEERGKKLLTLVKREKGGLMTLRTDQDFVPIIRKFFKMRKRQIR